MSEPPRTALVGAGRMGSLHARVLADSSAVDFVTIVEPSISSGRALAEDLGVTHRADLDELLAADVVDAVLIATPTPTHPELVGRCLEEGLHVLCEKPLSLDPGAGTALRTTARDRRLVLQVGFWRRFSPPWAAAKRLVDDGAIGRPLMIRLSQWDAAPPPPAFCDPAVSGGLAIDCGVHEYDLAEWFTGKQVNRVTAWNLPIVDEQVGLAGDFDNLVAVLDLEGGGVATVDLSRNARYADDVRTEILGETGAIFIDFLPTGRARVATAGGVATVPGSEAEDALVAGLHGQLEAFAAAVSGAQEPVPGADDSLRAVMIGYAVQEAARQGTAIVTG